jgi:CHAT domain-containing protein
VLLCLVCASAWAQSPPAEQPGGTKPPLTAEQKAKLRERNRLIARIEQLRAKGNLGDAARLLLQKIALEEAIFGQAHQEVANSLNELALLYKDMGRYADAEPLYQRSLKIYEARLGKDHPDVAVSLNNLANLYRDMGRSAEAEPLFQRSLKIYEARLRTDHPYVAISLNNLAELYRAIGRYADAEPLYQRSLKICEARLGTDHPDVASSLNNLALLHHTMGRYADAEPLFQRSLKILEARLGKDHPSVATCLNNLAALFYDMGRYAEAEPLYQRSLKILEARLGKDHPSVATCLNNLALLYHDMGRYAEHEPLLQRSLKILEAHLGKDHPSVATCLNNLARLYQDMGRYAEAEPLFQRSLKIREARLGKDHPDVAISLGNLATLYQDMGRYADAEPLFQRSLKIREARLGKDHPHVAACINNLALLYQDMGRYAEAEPLYQRSLKIREARLGKDHPSVAASLNNLAGVYQAMGRHSDAEPLYTKACGITQELLDKNGQFLSERQLLALTWQLRFVLDNYLSLVPKGHEPRGDSYARLLGWKGQAMLQERQRQLARRLHQGRDPESSRLYDRLAATSRELALLALKEEAPGKTSSAEALQARQTKLAELSKEVEALQESLARSSQVYRQAHATARLKPAQLAAALPKGAALVDYYWYRRRTPPTAGKGPWQYQQNLLAFIVRPGVDVERVDLGPVATIEAAVDNWRNSFGQSPKGRQAATALRKLVWEPVETKLQGVDQVLVSPDGPLGRFALAALPGKKPGSYLIEDWRLSIMPVARLLPELLASAPEKDMPPSLLAIGEVDYGTDPGAPKQVADRRSAARAANLPQWDALPDTRVEVLAVRDSFEQRYPEGRAKLLRNAQATEAAFRHEAPRHRWLHIATHGFFAPPQVRSALRPPKGVRDNPFGEEGIAGFHPGLLSGLVLAGANRPAGPDQDDGILTGVEVAVLDLSKVELAVLSACETGLGESAGGEGLLGLQRAFQVAGARSVVASLWKVDDKATRSLMERFYDNLWSKKLSKLEALRQAQLWMLREGRKSVRGLDLETTHETEAKDPRLPPYYWAAFVLSGDWR